MKIVSALGIVCFNKQVKDSKNGNNDFPKKEWGCKMIDNEDHSYSERKKL